MHIRLLIEIKQFELRPVHQKAIKVASAYADRPPMLQATACAEVSINVANDNRFSSTFSTSGVAISAPRMGVRVAPGTTTFTRMPRGDNSDAITRAIARTLAFDAA